MTAPLPPAAGQPRGRACVDVTTLMRWQGRWTGIPRTMSCILREWLDQELPLSLCRFDEARKAFLEVPLAELMDRQEQQMQDRPAPRPSEAPVPPPQPVARDRWLGKGLRSYLSRLPPELRSGVREAGSAALHLGRCLGRLGRDLVRRPKQSAALLAPAPGSEMSFLPGDVLLSPGGSWEDPSYLGVVGAWRQRVGLRLVPLVYDLIPHLYPQFFPGWFPPLFTAWLQRLLGLAERFVTISENSRNDLLAFAATSGAAPVVDVIRLGDQLPVCGPGQCPDGRLGSNEASKPYVLSVGTVEIRKNHVLLYRVWRRLIEEHGSAVPPLVIAGQRGWLCDDLQHEARTDPLVHDRLLLLEGLHDGELDWLYRHCLFTVFPSHYEGWGLPVCESLAHGKLCIASERSSLPEIAGPLIDYHDPFDFAACKAHVHRALFDEAYRRRREAEIQRHYRKTSWADCAAQLWSVLAADPAVAAAPVRQCA